MSVSELALVSIGLIIAYGFLVYNIKKYFKDNMILEIKSLTILFASFMIAYFLRTIYQCFLGKYKNVTNLDSPLVRTWIENMLWIIWDLVSIVSILILHYLNFKNKAINIIAPPSRNNSTYFEMNTDNDRSRKHSASNSTLMINTPSE